MKKRWMLFLLTVFLTTYGYSGEPQQAPEQGQRRMMMPGSVKGIVVDETTQKPIEYAYIILYSKRTNEQVTGTVTNKNGEFELTKLRPGRYELEIKFMGFQNHKIPNLVIGRGSLEKDVGTIALKSGVLVLEGVEVEAEKAALEFKIDKKVINVAKQYSAVSGTAVDVLENVPSVSVDIEGNVSLRGSSNFTVLIDGRPSILEANDALQQIPASTIENIEIITNPSAKFDPDGNAGIINVVTKQNKLSGISGLFNTNIGLDEKYGGDFLLSYRNSRYNIYIGGDYNKRKVPGSIESENRTLKNDTTFTVKSDGDMKWDRRTYGIKGGIDLSLTKNDLLSLGLRYGNWKIFRISDMNYNEWYVPGTGHQYSTDKTRTDRDGSDYTIHMDYSHKFKKQGHKISTQIIYMDRDSEEKSTNEQIDENANIIDGKDAIEKGPSSRLRLKLDYELPLRENDKFQAGYQSRMSEAEDINELKQYYSDTGTYRFNPEYSRTTSYERDIHSIYTMYAGEIGSFGYQGGLRGEYTYRFIELVGENQDFSIDRWDYFPTAHMSYKFSKGSQMMTSYTRRIHRPRGYYFEPFLTWTDAYNVRRGNPDIKPEYIDSYEMGMQWNRGRNLISTEVYYRMTHNKIERLRDVYAPQVFLHTVDNVGTDYSFGVELMLNIAYFKWWDLNLMGNIYNYKIEADLKNNRIDRNSSNWTIRFNNTFKIRKSTRFQLNGIYHSASVSAQGRRSGFFMTSAGLRQQFLENKLSTTLQIRDIFGTGKHDFTSEGQNFYSHSKFTRDAPIVTLTVTYNFNNYKVERQRGGENMEGLEGGEEEF